MVRRVPTTDVLIKRVIFVGRAVDSHSTGTGKKSPAPKRNYVLTSTAYIEIDTVSTQKKTKWLMANFISSVAPPYETMNVHFFCVCGACALQARGDLRRLERFWSSTIHNSEIEITFEIPPKKRHFFLL